MILSTPVASPAVHSKAVVLLLYIHCLFLLLLFVGVKCSVFVLFEHYFVSFLDLQASRWGRESWLLYLCCVLNGAL